MKYMKYKKYKKQSSKKDYKTVKILTRLLLTGVALAGIKGCLEYDTDFEKQSEFMLTNSANNKILTLPLNYNPIPVILNNFSDEQKQMAVQAITELDDISENIDYVILETDNTYLTQKININLDKNLMEENNACGIAKLNYKEATGEILFPVEIKIDPDCANYYSEETNENMFTAVMKHEMLHSLGFKDIYLEEEKYDTIMYYSMEDEYRALDYTQRDKENINFVYDVKEDSNLQDTTIYYKKEDEEREV